MYVAGSHAGWVWMREIGFVTNTMIVAVGDVSFVERVLGLGTVEVGGSRGR